MHRLANPKCTQYFFFSVLASYYSRGLTGRFSSNSFRFEDSGLPVCYGVKRITYHTPTFRNIIAPSSGRVGRHSYVIV